MDQSLALFHAAWRNTETVNPFALDQISLNFKLVVGKYDIWINTSEGETFPIIKMCFNGSCIA